MMKLVRERTDPPQESVRHLYGFRRSTLLTSTCQVMVVAGYRNGLSGKLRYLRQKAFVKVK